MYQIDYVALGKRICGYVAGLGLNRQVDDVKLPLMFTVKSNTQVLKEKFGPELRDNQEVRFADRLAVLRYLLNFGIWSERLLGIVDEVGFIYKIEGKLLRAEFG